ncbi:MULTISPECIES: dTDP-4-dehydrorhamnose 3,5-epimerase [Vibrionaceae]|uniref:dTDP-4-dehydrorhamnose 3,5-epimerase n=1 Tax=Aliivibrio sifiae TaxID=566293 RepID=A0A2S7X5P6_9GAMM|nr:MULTISPECIES: dTDP-4-dehydrorhamnose 3,5-epimerase [Vibrionaceae]MCC5519752.1 dTDP-4-dehydrorhamnose 3,5-epimerase [Vibrio splendidus]PMO03248.1 dTDP-4-dehydrorhamnose 3,5-epimerase [Vibrio splendidus]PQJ85385.1 dTDP-4-dehydrorhamnose 3,5-epimerase [Aliivibrio sifiae]GLR76437.1 dTDP-4-dehydrorhamnose 3,5-epimerase [Aliivibrio sifiae]
MKVIPTKLKDCIIIEPTVFGDDRGFFMEIFQETRYAETANIKLKFVQDNRSKSQKNVLRGLHFQKHKPQGKLVSVTDGEVFDVAVDLRSDSETFGQWEAVILSGENKRQFWVPPGFAHGFCVLSESADFQYKCTDYYDPNDESGLLWNDPEIGIEWPIKKPLLSDKDSVQPLLSDIKEKIKSGWKDNG